VLQPPLLLQPLGLPVPQLPHPIFYRIKRLKNNTGEIEREILAIGIVVLSGCYCFTCTKVGLLGFYHLGVKAFVCFPY
jgi:hypothetical protein